MASLRVFGLVTVALAAACAEDSTTPIFLGAAGSSSFEAPPAFVPGGAAGTAGASGAAGAPSTSACPLSLALSSTDAVASLDRDGATYLVGVEAETKRLSEALACPSSVASSATLGIGELRAVAVAGGIVFAAGATGARAGDATCPGGALSALAADGARAIGLSIDGKSLAKLTHSIVTKKDEKGNDVEEPLCAREDVPLAKGLFAVALGSSSVPGTVWASIVPSTGSGYASRVNTSTGALLTDVKLSSLCTADAFVDFGAKIAVLDATCPKVAIFDAKGLRVGDRPVGGAPRAMTAAIGDATAVLVASTKPTPPGVRLDFQLLAID